MKRKKTTEFKKEGDMILFPWKWYLSNGFPNPKIKYHGNSVFSCFCCGGGSTMGYKLAGYNVLGGLEVDPKIAQTYKKNHNPKYLYCEDIREFLKRDDIPEELYKLDILDGSPPCTPFSMAGIREKGWGVKKKYAEGSVYQTLDDLFLVFIQLLDKLQPKVAVIENVPGLVMGQAKKEYLPLIKKGIEKAGYIHTLVRLDSSKMGVPQKRERVFFICVRNDINIETKGMIIKQPKINLKFNYRSIKFKEVEDISDKSEKVKGKGPALWKKCKKGKHFSTVDKGSNFSRIKLHENHPACTLLAGGSADYWHPTICRVLNKKEWLNISTFPQDYNFINNKFHHIIGNSVPPVMMANLSYKIYEEILK